MFWRPEQGIPFEPSSRSAKVDVIGLQPLETGLHFAHDVDPRGAAPIERPVFPSFLCFISTLLAVAPGGESTWPVRIGSESFENPLKFFHRDLSLGDVESSNARPNGQDREEDQAVPKRPDQRGVAKIEPFLPRASKSGRPIEVDLREVLNAIRYMRVRAGDGGCCRMISRPGRRSIGGFADLSVGSCSRSTMSR